MKYIDADRLRAEIENKRSEIVAKALDPDADIERVASAKYKKDALSDAISIIDSLQQDPRFPLYDNIVEKVFGAGNLDGWERDEAEILVALAKEELLKSLQQEQIPTEREIAEAHHYMEMIRERDKARIQQESSEVDLEKEAVSFCFDNGINISPRQAKNIARHFFELGRARNEQPECGCSEKPNNLLQQHPEVDLENEINKVWDNGLSDELAGPHNNFDICAKLARYFAEWGAIHLNARKEQPEVDLEKELDRYLRGEFQQTAGGNFNNYIQVARHFYELGLSARKK